MKKWLVGLVAGVLASGAAQAALIDRGGGLIYDTYFDITWLRDANYAQTSGYNSDGLMTWGEANIWAANLVYHDAVRNVDYSNWRLPSAFNKDGTGPCAGFNCSGSELGHLFYVDGGLSAWDGITWSALLNSLFVNMQSSVYWFGTADALDPASFAWYFTTYGGNQVDYVQSYRLYSWAVRPGDVGASPAAAPEPATLALACAGLALAGLRRRHSFTPT